MSAVQRKTAQGVVVERPLHDFGVFALAGRVQQTFGEQHQRHRGAAFGVGGVVGQREVVGEGFAHRRGTDAARDVHPPFGEVVEKAFDEPPQFGVAGLRGDVGDPAVEIERPDGVSGGGGLAAHRHVRLKVRQLGGRQPFDGREVVRFRAALVDEVSGKIQITLFARRPVEFDQREFQLLVAGVAAFSPRLAPEVGGDQVGVTAHRVEELALAGRFEVGDGGFDQVPGAVKFVLVVEVGPAFFRFDQREVGVEVAVRLLG